jgi:hypothetical protein
MKVVLLKTTAAGLLEDVVDIYPSGAWMVVEYQDGSTAYIPEHAVGEILVESEEINK